MSQETRPLSQENSESSTHLDARNYFVAGFEHERTGPLSYESMALAFVGLHVTDDEDPVINDHHPHPTGEPLSKTQTVETVWQDGAIDIPDATDLTDPTQVAVWTAIATVPYIDRVFNAKHIAVFEVEQKNEHAAYAQVNDYDPNRIPYGEKHERVIDPNPSGPATQKIETILDWNDNLAPVEDLPDAKSFEHTQRLVTFRDGQDMHHPLGLYGVSAAETVPVAVRDVLQNNYWGWGPDVHRASHAATYTVTDLCGTDDPDLSLTTDTDGETDE